MIPQFTGDLEALEQDRTAIAAAASTFREAGADVDNEFQGLAAFYTAPEAAQLFATTTPVRTNSDFFADQLESAATALGEFVVEARPLVARLKQLQGEATAFTNKIMGDEHWKDDKKKTDENNDLIHDVNATAAAFWTAERVCASKIRALCGLPPLTADDGSHGANMHGYTAADLNKVQDLPWGSQLAESHRWYEIGHWTKSFVWDGIIVDGIVGTVLGLGTLVGVDGADAAGQAWKGLAKLTTGLALTTLVPASNVVFWTADDKAMPPWLRDSRNAMKETGKALVAWDQWNKNPARAAGAVTFNVLTTVFSSGAGTGAKTGAFAKAISAAGKAGRLIDPMTYVGQAAGKAGSLAFSKLKIGELFANLGKADGAFPKVDDVTWKDLPKADAPGVTFPHPAETVRLPDDALGRPQYYDKTTNQLLDHTGTPKQDLTAIPKGTDHPLAETPTRQEATVGAPSTHTAAGATHTPGGVADNTPRNSHTEPDGGGSTRPGSTDTTPTGGSRGDGPAVPHQGGNATDNLGPAPAHGHAGAGHGTGGPAGDGARAGDNTSTRSSAPAHPDPVVQRHVDLANDNPEWRRQHYRKNARRLSAEGTDELGNPLSMLRETGDPARPYTATDVQVLSPTYLGPRVHGDLSTLHPDYLEGLHQRAADRSTAIAYDNAAERVKLAAIAEYDSFPTPENEIIAREAVYEYKSTHTAMGDAGEHLGEDAAKFHAMRDIDPHAVRLDDGARGAHRFDQIWQTSDGRYVVIEAKASPTTKLGGRNLPGGEVRALQGTPEYFDEILLQMHSRGESDLADALTIARQDSNLDYIEIKANPVDGRYNGYFKRFFDIGRG
ncbi:hypothetical protein AB0D45_16495 [Streptomyces sp. NPDC048352]|uniref:hypothetical protein n=1 Tax=Streptomyces sp. NPDC048352 TaxID=3154718 RepID=UPI00342930C9